jgi:hypothetical protein
MLASIGALSLIAVSSPWKIRKRVQVKVAIKSQTLGNVAADLTTSNRFPVNKLLLAETLL